MHERSVLAIEFPLRMDRQFQLWSYQVSHRVLLLRSNITRDATSRVDLMFRSVSAMELRSRYEWISVDLASDSRREQLSSLGVEVAAGAHLFSIESAFPGAGYVVAGSFYYAEDDMDYGQPSSIDHPELAHRQISAGEFG